MLASPLLKLGVMAAILAGLIIYRDVLVHERDSARAAVVKLSGDLATCHANTTTLETAIKDRNTAIDNERDNERVIVQEARNREAVLATNAAAITAAATARARAHQTAQPAGVKSCADWIRWGNAKAAKQAR